LSVNLRKSHLEFRKNIMLKTLTAVIITIISFSIFISCGSDSKIKKEGSKKLDTHHSPNTSKQSNPPPTPKVKLKVSDALVRENKVARAFQADLERFILAVCVPSEKLYLEELTSSLLKNHPRSYAKTNKEDGKSFCIHEIYYNKNAISRIFYTRTEGGHYSDQISLWSLNKKTNDLKELILFSEIKKEGFHQEIKTSIATPYIFTVTQTDDPDSKKPIKTVKKYKLLDNGDIVSM